MAEGAEAISARYMKAADRVFAVLPSDSSEALSVQGIGDLVKGDATGKGPLKAATIRQALNRDLEGQVDRANGRWWRV